MVNCPMIIDDTAKAEPRVATVSPPESPSGTLGNGTEPSTEPVECGRCGVEVVPEPPGRCPTCKVWLPGNAANLRHGLRRYQETGLLPPDLQDYLLEFRQQVVEDLGGESSLSRIGMMLVDRLCELEASCKLQLDYAVRQSPDVKRGRAALADHRATADSQLRVARLLDAALPEAKDITPSLGASHA